jgi:ABC-2 type transport system permease protein
MNNNRRALILARRVIQQRLADRRTLAMMIFVPMILLSFMGVLIRNEPSGLEIGLVNDDQGVELAGQTINLGQRLQTVLGSFGEFSAQPMTADEARRKLDDGQVEAVIRIPADFTSGVVQTHHLGLAVEFEGSNPMISDRLNKLLERVALQTANGLALVGSPAADGAAVDLQTTIDATYLHGGADYDTLDYMAPALIGFFVFFFVFLLTCISFLRERIDGTLERLQATPIRSHEIITGYMLGFLLFGLLQGAVTLLFTVFVLHIHYAGNLLEIFVVEGLLVVLSVNLGIFLSTFAQNEFQVMQFMPLIVVSQGLLGGVMWKVEDMPGWLQPFSRLMPLTYANEALRNVMIKGDTLLDVGGSLLILVGFAVLFVLLASRTAGRAKI